MTALDWDQLEDCGGYLRAPEPETLYRRHGGQHDRRVPVANLAIRKRVVLTTRRERLGARVWRTAGLFPPPATLER